MMVSAGPPSDRSFRGPVVSPLPCPGCGRLVDPLRAGHVAIFHDRFLYFCEWGCRQDYLAREPDGPGPSPPLATSFVAMLIKALLTLISTNSPPEEGGENLPNSI